MCSILFFKFFKTVILTVFKTLKWVIPEKSKHADQRSKISRSIEERACENSRGQLKKKRNFQEWSRKIHVQFLFMGFCLAPWNFRRMSHYFKASSLVFSRISKYKVTNLKTQRFFQKSIFSPPCLSFYGISQCT